MNAKMCDRCGEFYIEPSRISCGTNVHHLYLNANNAALDLCCDCRHDLDEWFSKIKNIEYSLKEEKE